MSLMSDKERDELLIRLDERLSKVKEDMGTLKSNMSSDEGFTRCQLHAQRVNGIENSIATVKRIAWAAVIGLVVKVGWDKLAPHINSDLSNVEN